MIKEACVYFYPKAFASPAREHVALYPSWCERSTTCGAFLQSFSGTSYLDSSRRDGLWRMRRLKEGERLLRIAALLGDCVGDVCAWLLSGYLWKAFRVLRGDPFDNKNPWKTATCKSSNILWSEYSFF